MRTLHFEGNIKNVEYSPQLTSELESYRLDTFDVNQSRPFGLVTFADHLQTDEIAYAVWKTPKRTRTYPFARMYNIYGRQTKRIAIIPIIKDEGADANNDMINFITFSWMNLLNIHVILSWFESASRVGDSRISNQRLNANYICSKIDKIRSSQQSALHWNTAHFENDFVSVYQNAIEAYKRISVEEHVRLHSYKKHEQRLERCAPRGIFDLQAFKTATLDSSFRAAMRESKVIHKLEQLSGAAKGVFTISNYLGGSYHLTVDEVIPQGKHLILQEAKNSTQSRLPAVDDIKDGLFKLILFRNLHSLKLDGVKMNFSVRLRLSGNFRGSLILPGLEHEINTFLKLNEHTFNPREAALIHALQREAAANQGLTIVLDSGS